MIPVYVGWRLGYHSLFSRQNLHRQSYGHFGFGGSGAWANAELDLAAGMIGNAAFGTPFGDMRISRISEAIVDSAASR